MKYLLIVLCLSFSIYSFAAVENQVGQQKSLEDQLNSLQLPQNKLPQLISNEKLYAVQDRYVPLKMRLEIGPFVGQNFTSEGHLTTQVAGAWIQFHFTDKWGLQFTGTRASNQLNSSGKKLLEDRALIPDVDFLKYQMDLGLTFNTFYGKFRLVSDTVMYFDQYLLLGTGVSFLNNGPSPMLVGDAGFAFWPTKSFGVRVGLREQVYNENREGSKVKNFSMIGHLDISYLFGGKS